MAGDTSDQDSAQSLQTRVIGNGPKGRIETLQELCDRLEVRINEAIELASQPRAAERRDARIIADLERRISALEQIKDPK